MPRRWMLVVVVMTLVGCKLRHEIEVEPTHHTVKIEPIFMTVDINLRVQQQLDAFYEDVESEAQRSQPGAEP